jgi:hypothetical protein
MTDIYDNGEYRIDYQYESDPAYPGRRSVVEILAYSLNGKQLTATELEEAGFLPIDAAQLQAELDIDYEESFKP